MTARYCQWRVCLLYKPNAQIASYALLKREKKKERQKEERGRGREGREEKRTYGTRSKTRKENVQDEIECGRLLDFAIESKFYLFK
jgi:hypothetical protein